MTTEGKDDNDGMFEATLDQGDIFKKVIASVSDLVSDGNFECTDEGIRLQAMDSSHVSLVSLFLAKDAFSNFQCTQPLTIGINFPSLQKVLKTSKVNDSLTLKHKIGTDTVTIIFSSSNDRNENARTVKFDLKLMDIEGERLVIPETEYTMAMAMSSKEYKSIMNELHNIGDSLTLSATKEGCKFGITGDIGSGDITMKNSNNDENIDICDGYYVNMECQQPISQAFALRYLVMFTKAVQLSNTVNLYMTDNVPLVVEFKLSENAGHVKYYLAPKIDEENDDN